MNESIRTIVQRTQRSLRNSWVIFIGCLVTVAVLLVGFGYLTLNNQARAMMKLFDRRLMEIDAMLDETTCCTAAQTWAVVSRDGRVVASSWRDAVGTSIVHSSLFRWLSGVRPDTLSITIAPVLDVMPASVVVAANRRTEYRLVAWPPRSLFALEGSHTNFIVVNASDLCVYSTDESWIGEQIGRFPLTVDRSRIFMTRRAAFAHKTNLELIVFIDITNESRAGLALALFMAAASAIFWWRNRRISRELGLLETEQSQATAMVHRFTQGPPQGAEGDGVASLETMVSDLARASGSLHFTFEENRRFNDVIQDLCRHILHLTSRLREDSMRLRDRELSLRSLLHNLPDLVIRFAADLTIDYANPAVARFLSAEPEALRGKSLAGAGFPQHVSSFLGEALGELFHNKRMVESEVEIDHAGRRAVFNWRLFPEVDTEGAVISALSVARDVTDIKGAEELVLSIAHGVSAEIGGDFFRTLVGDVARAVGADYSFIGTLAPGRTDRIRTVALVADGAVAENIEYDLAGTPCGIVMAGGTCSYLSDVQRTFPDDRLLADMQAQAYIGCTIEGVDGSSLGIMVVVFRRPLDGAGAIEAMMKIFAVRIAAELQRLRAEEALAASELKYRELVQHANSIILRMLPDGTVTFINEFAERFFGFSRDEILGRNVVGTIVPPRESTGRNLGELIGSITKDPDAYRTNVNENMRKNGELVWIAWTNRGIMDEEGRVVEVLCIGNDITAQQRLEEQMNRSLREKEVLLKEIHHRVKNNMQVISSLLSLQTEHLVNDHDRSLFVDSQNMVRSMALVHERLYQSKDLSAIDFADYLDGLVNDVLDVYDLTRSQVTITLRTESAKMDIDTAIPCALVVCELITNALKHAFTERDVGEVVVTFTSAGPLSRLEVADNGVGFPADLDFRNTTSLGLQLVNGLVHQLKGSIELVRDGGTRFIIEFPSEGVHHRQRNTPS